VERFSNITEEQHIIPAVILLLETLSVAILLAFVGIYLVNLSMETIWLVFAISIPIAIAAGNYTGLRLNEFFRFDKLKKND
jgi:hypothetical protein